MPRDKRKRGPADAALLRELLRYNEFDATTIMCAMPKDAALRDALQFLELRMLPTDRFTKPSYEKLQRWLYSIEAYLIDGLYLRRASTGWCRIIEYREIDQHAPIRFLPASDEQAAEQMLGAVIRQWRLHLGADKEYRVREVIERALRRGEHQLVFEFRDALLVAAGKNGAISSFKLGRWLAINQGRLIDGRRIVKARVVDGVQYWKLIG
jgi:hypothetical protein